MVPSIHSSPLPISVLLQRVLGDPKLLNDFEHFLGRTWCHENLLFIEAMSQLRHEENQRYVENSLHRIYKTFIAVGAPMELNISTQEQVKRKLESLRWSIVDREEALETLKDTESEVLALLQSKLSEYIQTQQSTLQGSDTDYHDKKQIHICIIGGGFVGFTVASILDAMPLFHVTLIDTKAAFEYTPGIVKKLTNPHQSTSLRVQHDSYVRNGRVIIGYADEISEDAKSVMVNNEQIHFDYMVMATGSSYSSQLKSTDISALYRLTGLEEAYTELLTAETILIIGGGLVGCELASEISQTTFPGPYPHKKVTVVESNMSLVCRSAIEQQQKATKFLSNLGVKVICNERIIDFDAASTNNTYIGSSGKLYQGYDKVFLTTGTLPNTSLFSTSPTFSLCVDTWGRIQVKPTLQVDHWEFQHIFAGGDVTNVVEEKTGYAATIAGVCIARNICRMVKGKEPLKQGTKGTLAAPRKPLHGISSQGGIGKQKLGGLKKAFSFLNPSWAALKYFNEQQFLQLVQGQQLYTTHGVIGRLPRLLTLSSLDGPSSGASRPSSIARNPSASTMLSTYVNNSSRLSCSISLHSTSTNDSDPSSSASLSCHDRRYHRRNGKCSGNRHHYLEPMSNHDHDSLYDSASLRQFISDKYPYQQHGGVTSSTSTLASKHHSEIQQVNINSKA